MRTLIYSLLLFVAVLLAAYFSNPKEDYHKQEIENQFNKTNPLTGMLGGGKLFTQMTHYTNHVVYSTVEFDGQPVSIGAFGMVFLTDSLDVNKALK